MPRLMPKPMPRVMPTPVRSNIGGPKNLNTIGATVPGGGISDPYYPRPTGNFQGDTSVPNMNTIGPASPMGGGFNTPTGQFNASTAPALPIGAVYKKGGKVKKMASGGMTSKVSSASKRADGIAQRGKTRGKMV